MYQRMQRLDDFLHEVGLLKATAMEPENWVIHIEQFDVSGDFMEQDNLIPMTAENGHIIGFEPAASSETFRMSNRYQMSLVIKNYGGNIEALQRVLLRWMHQEQLLPKFNGMAEMNNQSTYDLWFDFDITEHTHNADDGVVTC